MLMPMLIISIHNMLCILHELFYLDNFDHIYITSLSNIQVICVIWVGFLWLIVIVACIFFRMSCVLCMWHLVGVAS